MKSSLRGWPPHLGSNDFWRQIWSSKSNIFSIMLKFWIKKSNQIQPDSRCKFMKRILWKWGPLKFALLSDLIATRARFLWNLLSLFRKLQARQSTTRWHCYKNLTKFNKIHEVSSWKGFFAYENGFLKMLSLSFRCFKRFDRIQS